MASGGKPSRRLLHAVCQTFGIIWDEADALTDLAQAVSPGGEGLHPRPVCHPHAFCPRAGRAHWLPVRGAASSVALDARSWVPSRASLESCHDALGSKQTPFENLKAVHAPFPSLSLASASCSWPVDSGACILRTGAAAGVSGAGCAAGFGGLLHR